MYICGLSKWYYLHFVAEVVVVVAVVALRRVILP